MKHTVKSYAKSVIDMPYTRKSLELCLVLLKYELFIPIHL